MWPRTEEERRRQRKCGFVAFMNRADGQAAKDEMQGVVVYDYEVKIEWGKSVSLPSQALPAPPPGHMAIGSKEGDTLQRWGTEPFIMITGSGRWIPPDLPVFRSPGHEKESSATFVAGRNRVLLPLDHSDGFKRVEIMVCGGGASGAHLAAKKRHQFMTGLSSCGRMVLTDERPAWHVEQMPAPHLMSDMILLPTGDVLIINGASHGVAGWNNAHNPSLSPYLYKPNATIGHRFSALRPTHIPRMYHSSAILLPDGRILVAGSNTHSLYTFTGVAYPTELRVEAFMPYYMSKIFNCNRPANVSITYKNGKHGVRYGEEFVVRFKVRRTSARMEFHMYAPPFVTHSLSMNQRLLKLRCGNEGGGT